MTIAGKCQARLGTRSGDFGSGAFTTVYQSRHVLWHIVVEWGQGELSSLGFKRLDFGIRWT